MARSYIEIKKLILDAIACGELEAGERVGPLRMLCEEYRASLITIDRALRELAREGKLVRKPRRGFFVADSSEEVKGAIHVFVSTISSLTSFPELVGGVEQITRGRGYQMSLCCTNSDVDRCIQAARKAVAEGARGVVLAPAGHGQEFARNAEVIRVLRDNGIPVVTAGHCMLDGFEGLSGASSDHQQAGYALVRHLLNLGRRRIAVLGERPNQDYEDVLRGYHRALQEEGLEAEERLIRFYESSNSAEMEVKQLLHAKNMPDAIFAFGDAVAAESMRGLVELGLSVPQDISLVGFGDFPVCRFLAVPLTTVRVRLGEIGQLAAGMLLDLIEGVGDEGKHIELPCELVVRKSCGANQISMSRPGSAGRGKEAVSVNCT